MHQRSKMNSHVYWDTLFHIINKKYQDFNVFLCMLSCFVTNDRKYLKHPNLANIFFYGTDFRNTFIKYQQIVQHLFKSYSDFET